MRDKKSLLYLLIISTFILAIMTIVISAQTMPDNAAKSFALYNPDTKSFVFGKDINRRLPMASTTKIITALIALEELDKSEMITVPSEAVGIEGSSLYLSSGDLISAEDLIYGVLLQSANDAATVLALRIGDSIDNFSQIMNERAASIGAYNTNFENPHGLDSENHYTTAHDLALISAEAIKNEDFKKISSTYKRTIKINGKDRVVVNHNKLLKTYNGCVGVKTGYTKRCGRCLVSAAERDNITLIAVTLNDPNDWRTHSNMLDNGFEIFKAIYVSDLVSIPEELPIINGNKDNIKIGINSTENRIIAKKDGEVTVKDITLRQYIVGKINIGDTVGTITVEIDDLVKTINIIALESSDTTSRREHLWKKWSK